MTGPKIIFTIPIFGGISITETVVNTWIVMLFLMVISTILTRNLKKIPSGKQVLVEKGVSILYDMVENVMGREKLYMAPYMGSLFLLVLCCNLLGMFGLRPPTVDLNTTAAFAVLMFVLVQFFAFKNHGFVGRFKALTEPVPVALPLNIIGEFSNPTAMTFRLFGNISSGMIVGGLVYGALGALTQQYMGLDIPIFAIGLPAVLSAYFDLFAGVIQAYIIMMLQMIFISMA